MRFLLIHGGFHGAWCWDYLVPELHRLGHTALAIDLPGHGERAHEVASLSGYKDAVLAHIQPGDILVAHSMGGVAATLAANEAPEKVRHIVYLAAALPLEGKAFVDLAGGSMPADPTVVEPIDGGKRVRFISEPAAIKFYYGDCSPELAHWAYGKLTPQPIAPLLEPISVPRFWQADLPRSLIMGRRDALGTPEGFACTMKRLGVDPLWGDWSRSPFLSQPKACAETILVSIERAPIGPPLPEIPT